MDPEPLLRIFPNGLLDYFLAALCVFDEVRVFVAAAHHLDGRAKAQHVDAALFVPESEAGDDGSAGPHGDLGDAARGARFVAEEINEDAVLAGGVLIRENADVFVVGQRAQGTPPERFLADELVAGEHPAVFDVAIEVGVIESSPDDMQGMSMEAMRIGAHFPVAEVRSEIQDAATALVGFGVVVVTVVFEPVFDVVQADAGGAGDEKQYAPEVLVAAADDLRPAGLSHFRESQPQIPVGDVAPLGRKGVGERGKQVGQEPREGQGEPFESFEDGPGESVFGEISQGPAATHPLQDNSEHSARIGRSRCVRARPVNL